MEKICTHLLVELVGKMGLGNGFILWVAFGRQPDKLSAIIALSWQRKMSQLFSGGLEKSKDRCYWNIKGCW